MPNFITKITDFSGSLSEDKRVQVANKFSLTKHFDAFTYPHKLVPYYKTVSGGSANGLVKALYAPTNFPTDTTFRIFGYAVNATKASIVSMPIDTNLDTNQWAGGNGSGAAAAKITSTVNNRDLGVFFYYKGFIYMWAGSRYLTRYDVTDTANFNDAYFDFGSAGITSVAQPVHHPNDDVAYFFYNNIVSKQDGAATTFTTTAALTLPSNLKIVSACPYANYLAIGCTTKNTFDRKITAFLWDRDSSLATLTERVDFGVGTLLALANLDNSLIAVVNAYRSDISSTSSNLGAIYVKRANGSTSDIINTLVVDDSSNSPILTVDGTGDAPAPALVENNKLYIALSPKLNGDSRLGVWAIDSSGRATLDSMESTATDYLGLYKAGHIWWYFHEVSNPVVHRTDINQLYSTTIASIYESLIFNGDDTSQTKKLIGISVMTEPLPSAGQVILKYRKDQETSWTTIFTNSTDNSVNYDAVNIESTGDNLPHYNEIQFQINSLGGAVITGLRFAYQIVEDGAYQP